MHILWMVFPLVICWTFGIFVRNTMPATETVPTLLLSLVWIYFMLDWGYYWEVFPRGHGFFTANRMSAALVMFATVAAPTLVELFKLRRR